MEKQFGRGGETLRGKHPLQEIGALPKADMLLLHAVEPHPAVRQGPVPIRPRHRGVLPRQVQAIRAYGGSRKAVSGGRQPLSGHGHPAGGYRLAHPVAVRVFPYERPAVGLPVHGLEVDNAAVGALVLEMEEPVSPVGARHPGALVRTVHRSGGPGHHNLFFIRAIYAAGAEHRLPAGGHSAGGGKDIVPTVPLVELGPLDGGLRQVAVENKAGRACEGGSIGLHRGHKEDALEPGAGTGGPVRKPGVSLRIPKRAGVYEALLAHHPDGRLPSARDILRLNHENAPVRVSYIDIEPAVVVTDGRGPDAAAVLHRAVESGGGIIRERSPHLLPMDQIARVEDGQSREEIEGGRRHIIVVPHPAYIRVGIIEMKDGIGEIHGLLYGAGDGKCY